MKIKELRGMADTDLRGKLLELRKDLAKDNAQIAVGTTPKSPGRVKQMKKTIARILTIIHTRAGQKPANEVASKA